MSPELQHILTTASWLAYNVALAVVCLACLRLAKRSGDRTWRVSAWLGFAYLLIVAITYTASFATPFLNSHLQLWIEIENRAYLAADILCTGHLLSFAVAVFRRVRSLPARRTAPDGCDGELAD
ncbi:hypothetical protein OKA04_06685 [Luteolibacter flavescens]|uniref:Integral membrane protein n=1 Tax=Luteolibacter flavescens TaxID=1859460 RepID=A0ABT3FLE7_9BACT|nr:hypothetical protein [Luteolibacter flavescens]MCW1884411.1 hypothetical protein [Luteolibacter flavescens]